MDNASQNYIFTLNQVLIALHTRSTDTYGTPYDLDADQIFEVDPQADTDTMRDSGQVTRKLAVFTHANISITAGGVDFLALNILTNGTAGQSYFKPVAGGAGLNYFGAIGVASSDEGKILVVGLRSCKLDTIPMIKFDGQTNKFNVSDMKGSALAIDQRVFIGQVYDNLAAWNSAKPTDGATFKTWLTA